MLLDIFQLLLYILRQSVTKHKSSYETEQKSSNFKQGVARERETRTKSLRQYLLENGAILFRCQILIDA